MKKTLPFIILSLVLVVGVAGYFVWKHFEKKEAEKKAISPNTEPVAVLPTPSFTPEVFIAKPPAIDAVIAKQEQDIKTALSQIKVEQVGGTRVNHNNL